MNRVALYIACTICALTITMSSAGSALAGRRVALVIGNSSYKHADMLPNTINDARAVTAMLKVAGFDSVEERENLGAIEFKRALRDFMSAVTDADIAIVYFSGHGIEINGTNYVVPVDAKLVSDFDTEDEAISLDRIILAVQPAQRLRLIILDACRDNPFLRGGPRLVVRRVARGLLPAEPLGADTLIAYAAKAGSVSFDGDGASSPFTTAVVKYLAEPGLDVRIAFGRVRDQVLATTARRQEPFLYGSLGGATISLVPAPTQPAVPADPGAAMLNDYMTAERIGTQRGWEAFLASHGSGIYADLARARLAKLVAEGAASRSVTEATPAEKEPKQLASKERDCKRDSERLARLRSDPTVDEAERLSHELTCDDLRPQLARLLESLGAKAAPSIGSAALPQSRTSTTPERSPQPPATKEQICKRESESLARLRANPKLDEIKRFSNELACEELRPQTLRLLESIGG